MEQLYSYNPGARTRPEAVTIALIISPDVCNINVELPPIWGSQYKSVNSE